MQGTSHFTGVPTQRAHVQMAWPSSSSDSTPRAAEPATDDDGCPAPRVVLVSENIIGTTRRARSLSAESAAASPSRAGGGSKSATPGAAKLMAASNTINSDASASETVPAATWSLVSWKLALG